jgi:hypothetical protein
VIADAAHWRIVGGGKDTAGQFVAVAALAARKLGHPSTEWWRWLDVLQANDEAVADDEPMNIAEPRSGAIIDTIAIGTIYLLNASANEAARQAMTAVVSPPEETIDGRSLLAKNLDGLRKRLDLSYWRLAREVRIEQRQCTAHLNGCKQPNGETVKAYAAFFSGYPELGTVTPDDLRYRKLA